MMGSRSLSELIGFARSEGRAARPADAPAPRPVGDGPGARPEIPPQPVEMPRFGRGFAAPAGPAAERAALGADGREAPLEAGSAIAAGQWRPPRPSARSPQPAPEPPPAAGETGGGEPPHRAPFRISIAPSARTRPIGSRRASARGSAGEWSNPANRHDSDRSRRRTTRRPSSSRSSRQPGQRRR